MILLYITSRNVYGEYPEERHSMIELYRAKGQTGLLVEQMLKEAGVKIGRPGEACISYGVNLHHAQKPCLNKNSGRQNKYEELVVLRKKGVLVPDHSRNYQPFMGRGFSYLGREFHHARGKGIRFHKAGTAPMQHSEFYMEYVPKVAEYRVWAFRRTPKALYQKVKRYPAKGVHKLNPLVWNRKNGYAFEFVHPDNRTAQHQQILKIGAAAIDALDLDFGAADIIVGEDGKIYVLEVNTAPGVEGPRHGLTSLVTSMAKWVGSGYPARNGSPEAEAKKAGKYQ